MVRSTLSVKQIEYKNAELVLCEFMALQEYDVGEWNMPKYSDFDLQEFHDFVSDKIEAFDSFNNNGYPWWKRWHYQIKKE